MFGVLKSFCFGNFSDKSQGFGAEKQRVEGELLDCTRVCLKV